MLSSMPMSKKPGSLRSRLLVLVGTLIVLSVLASTISLYRITEVNRLLDVMNRVSVPLGRLITQMHSDGELLGRELDRSFGNSHWKDPNWRPRSAPQWLFEVLEDQVSRAQSWLQNSMDWAPLASRDRWQSWVRALPEDLRRLQTETAALAIALENRDETSAKEIYPRWIESLEGWQKQIQWGTVEYERSFRQTFSLAESRVAQLQTGLETILIVVITLSLMVLWLGEKALRPLAELTQLAREITRRGLRKEDKSLLPEISLSRTDEVSHLAREFHHMATALLEREKTVEAQKNRLIEQNRLLHEMGELNENVLNSIASILIVTDLSGKVTQVNPVAKEWLGSHSKLIGTDLVSWSKITPLCLPKMEDWKELLKVGSQKIDPQKIEERVFGGQLFPLLDESGNVSGAILVLEDLTEELDLQERLRRAENLAAIGRMSAQVAHEVRNPLHSIGLEAEVAIDLATRIGNLVLKQSLQSILYSVDRLEKITENYLKLSRLSAGKKRDVDLLEVLDSVLAMYSPVCEAQGVRVDWKREGSSLQDGVHVWGDADLLEQVFGNLFKNALQALEGVSEPRISWVIREVAENGQIRVSIEDNGPGVASEIRSRLFTPFVTTRAQGTGLGLSFVKKVLEDHEGLIWCADQTLSQGAQSQGACFEFQLPRAEGQSHGHA